MTKGSENSQSGHEDHTDNIYADYRSNNTLWGVIIDNVSVDSWGLFLRWVEEKEELLHPHKMMGFDYSSMS